MEFTITLVQIACREGDRESNYKTVERVLKELRPTDCVNLIVLPELFAVGFRHEDYDRISAGIPGPTSDFLSRIAKKHEAYVFGTGIEKSEKRYYNTLAAATPSGEILGTYRKIHPFQEEHDVFDGGTKIVLMDCGGIKVGVQICYDIRFPEVSRKLALEGAEILVVSAAFPDPRSAHWNALVQARAIENQLYVAAANRIGLGFDKKIYFGHSQIVDPWGLVLTRCNSEERIIHTKGNTDMLSSVRKQITCYLDRARTGYDTVQRFPD
ncbi:MAG: hypothetical protein JW779_06740 [Candidatus Thorarchaeota archaeon]|nr:hypothetical protein [Candidatus Thorarchaeota archaeon]